MTIAELVQRRNQEHDNAVLDRALRRYLIEDLGGRAFILPSLDVMERVSEIHAHYGYELVEVVWPERVAPRPRRWDPEDGPAIARHYSARELEQFARETRE
jgi:hypothetical protein